MSYQIYTTQALILKRIPYDANVSYLLYTKDFGLISALATGVRKSESKLRYALQEYSLIDISLVKGRSTWRITSAILEKNLFTSTKYREAKAVIARICTQVMRLVVGQEKDERLFESLVCGLRELTVCNRTEISSLEILIMIRMLYILGYVSDVEGAVCSVPYTYDTSVYIHIESSRSLFIQHINKGLQESQL